MKTPTTILKVQQEIAQRKYGFQPKITALIMALVVVAVIALNAGAVDVDLWRWLSADSSNPLQHTILWDIRFPRIVMTMITGAGLALCGTVLQAICRNPLADPGLIGVSSSAALFAGAAFAVLSTVHLPLFLMSYFVPLSAFLGATLSLILLLKIADSKQGMNTLVLILAGVAINAGAMTLLGLIQFVVDDATLRQITFWSMGSYAGINYTSLSITIVPVILGTYYFWQIRHQLMLMSCSENQAKYQGVDTRKIKLISLWTVAAIVAVCVSFTGIVGFVGLVVPHLCRMMFGAHLNVLLPTSLLSGALLVALADTLARTIIIPAEIPIGLITSMVGVPFFLYLIVREKRKFDYV
ncbi:FecCD family ABC transporter permease [Brumicola pallidula]|uniref:Iron complex transport system permease protein n=1 Tax=Brumicola pallidula DSM 14239 = ACAM 615 TaxID=1121922 RepID=K6ZVV9_9ALTE|nr:iron ABC transporter permease [Glaciecola pallidula]GAC27460.1 iron complex transport system permease protein [Glaciecola pallidula DSM 14239 = ACAM 615]